MHRTPAPPRPHLAAPAHRQPSAVRCGLGRGLARGLTTAATVLALLPSAQALQFNLSFTPDTTAQQQAAFRSAADYWSALLLDPVTINLDVGFAPLGNGVLAQAGSTLHFDSYTSIRSSLRSSADSAVDSLAYAHLQPGSALRFQSSDLDGNSRLNADTSGAYSTDNTRLGMTTANAKALGLMGASAAIDGTIHFNTQYTSIYQFDRSGGIASNKTDFTTVAEHEIAHVLGFVSGVDDADFCRAAPAACGLSGADPRELETFATYGVLDLFRYSAAGVLDLRVGGAPYFSIDGGATVVTDFSTGADFGDGWQASHFGSTELTLMRPFVADGESYDATPADLMALDVIGWTLAAPVPEPATWGLMALGLVAAGWRVRRR